MSYSSQIKAEASEMKLNKACCIRAVLTGLAHSAGSIDLAGKRRFGLTFTSENEDVVRLVSRLLRKENAELPVQTAISSQGKRKSVALSVLPSEETAQLMQKLGLLRSAEEGLTLDFSLSDEIVKKDCCRRAYLRGIFLGCATVSDVKKGYRCDMVFRREEQAVRLCELLAREEIGSSLTQRQNSYVVYVKDSTGIQRLFSAVGAQKAVLDVENVRLLKELTNQANRAFNCDAANINRTVEASQRQLNMIDELDERGILKTLPEALRRTAEVRRENPDATLEELCVLCGDGVTKSGMNHRLRKLAALVEQARKEDFV